MANFAGGWLTVGLVQGISPRPAGQGSLIINTNKYLINNNTYNTKYESSRIVLYCCITTAARTHTRARLPGAEHPVPQQAAPKLCLQNRAS